MKTTIRWNGTDWKEYPLCENAVKNTDVNFGQGIGIPQCYDGIQKFSATIFYVNTIGDVVEENTVKICRKCLERLKKSVRKQGYKLTYDRIRR